MLDGFEGVFDLEQAAFGGEGTAVCELGGLWRVGVEDDELDSTVYTVMVSIGK